ncbi:MAG TPA: hypothetical protein VD903_01825 [Pseudonocardia sp.]|nr:hypothetical protein [Pseudonocardia sp.]
MDIRFAAFALIARDAELRTLLVNHADRIEHERGVLETCFLALDWSGPDPFQAPAATQMLAARAHLPCGSAADRSLLDLVLARVRVALGAGSGAVAIRFLGTSPPHRDAEFDTLVRSSTFAVAPRDADPRHPARIGTRRGRRPRDLARGRPTRTPTWVTPAAGPGMLRDHRAR